MLTKSQLRLIQTALLKFLCGIRVRESISPIKQKLMGLWSNIQTKGTIQALINDSAAVHTTTGYTPKYGGGGSGTEKRALQAKARPKAVKVQQVAQVVKVRPQAVRVQ